MAVATKCQTPDACFSTEIRPDRISVAVVLPVSLPLTDEQAETLEANLHNAVELVLAPYYFSPAEAIL